MDMIDTLPSAKSLILVLGAVAFGLLAIVAAVIFVRKALSFRAKDDEPPRP